jgi:polyhydroxybutyrate depolymerase
VTHMVSRARRSLLACAGIAAALMTSGCGYMWGIEHAPLLSGPGPHSGWMRVNVGGDPYDVDLHLPPKRFLNAPISFVIVLHGSGGTGPGMERRTRFSELADSVGFAVAYPESHRTAQHRRLWGTPESTSSDIAMMRALVDSVAGRASIDRRRVYLAGFSNGGGMAYRAARALPNVFAGIGVVAGTLDGGSNSPSSARAMPLIAVHGMQDHTVPFDGEGRRPSAPAAVRAWAERNGCAMTATVDTIPSIDFIRTTYGACPSGADAILYAGIHGGHGWPNSGTHEAPLQTTVTLWQFFAHHSLN